MSEDLKTKVLIGAVAVALSAPMVATKATATAPIKTFVFKSYDILKLLLPINALNIGSV